MYSIHSSTFGKSGITMRPVVISEDDDALFNANFSPLVAITYQNHVKEIRRMVKQQGNGFWIRFVTSLRSHAEQHRLMDGIAFARAEAVFVDMLQLLTCGDNLQELTRLVNSLRAMQSAIIANDYQILMDPVLRIMMTHYDKPLDGLRLYFRFVAGLVVMFRRWKQAAWRTKKEEGLPPWEPPPHWKEVTTRDYSEWTFEGNLLCMFGPDLLNLLGLPPGLPCWMPDELKNGILVYPSMTLVGESFEQGSQDMNRARNKRKGRRRKNRQFDDGLNNYESFSNKAAPSSGDSGDCLIDQGMEILGPTTGEILKDFTTNICVGGTTNSLDEDGPLVKYEELENKNCLGSVSKDDSLSIEHKTPVNGQNKDIPDEESDPVLREQSQMLRAALIKDEISSDKGNRFIISPHLEEQCMLGNRSMKDCSDETANHSEEEHYMVANEERPDYLYVLECRGPNILQNGQFPHPGAMPPLEHNYGPNYDQCLHIYRRDFENRIMMGPNNFRPHLEEMSNPRPPPWAENPGNFINSTHMGFYEAPVSENMGSDLRRRGPPNRRYRQKRMRPPSLGTIEETPDSIIKNEGINNVENGVTPPEAMPISSFMDKKQWRSKKPTNVFDNVKDGEAEKFVQLDAVSPILNEQQNTKVSDIDTSKPPEGAIPINTCTSGYALAVCGLLGRSDKVDKESRKLEENHKCENISHSIIINSQKSKKPKRKPGRQRDNLSNDTGVRIPLNKDLPRDSEKGKRFSAKQTENTNAQKCYIKSNMGGKGKFNNYRDPNTDVKKFEKINTNEETSFVNRTAKGMKHNTDFRTGGGECDGVRPNDKRRKWKSVWTRRRDPESIHHEEKPTTESDGLKRKEVNTNSESNARGGIPQNVPDILKQVENAELKGFWKYCNEAPKPQRKFRATRREGKRMNGLQDVTRESDDHVAKEEALPPIVKLDVIPAVEPNDREPTKKELPESIQKGLPLTCSSGIGWYEETLAEDKVREKQRQANNTEMVRIQGPKKNKTRKWKKKTKKGKEGRNTNNSLIEEESEELKIKGGSNENEKCLSEQNNKDVREQEAGSRKRKENDSLSDFQENSYTNRHTSKEYISKFVRKKYTADKINNEEFQHKKQYDVKIISHNIEGCKAILSEVLLRFPDKSQQNSTKENGFEPLISLLQSDERTIDNFHNFKIIQDMSYKKQADNLCNKLDLSSGSQNTFEDGRNHGFHLQSTLDPVVSKEKSKDYEIAMVNRRRQVYLARTLKYLASLKTYVPLFTKRDVIKLFLLNEDMLLEQQGSVKKYDPDLQVIPASTRALSKMLDSTNSSDCLNKKLLYRRCNYCNVLEKHLGEHGECVRCKERGSHSPRVYCSRLCQLADWKRQHRAEHNCQDQEDMS